MPETVTFDRVIEAVYTQRSSSIASPQTRGEAMLSILLAEGSFEDGAEIAMEPVTAEEVGSMDSSKFVEGWKVTLPEDGSITHLMRYCMPEGGGLLKLYLMKDGGAVPLDTQKDGQYLCFNADGTQFTYIKVDVEGYSAASFTPSAVDTLIRRGEEAALAQKNTLIKLKQELGLDSTYMPKPLPSYPYSPNRKVYIKEITFDGLDEKDKRWLLKRCDLKEDSEISLRRIEEATAILCSNLEYSSATYNLPEAPGGGYNLHFLLSKKYENKLNVGIRFDSEETASLLINVTSNFRGKVPTTLSLTGIHHGA